MDILVTYISVNRRGQQQRDQQRVAGPTINIGRGTQCQAHLPDPRVALHHALITVSESGATIEAEPGRIQINGRAVAGARLAVGDRIEVGPYLLEVDEPPAGVMLALAVTLVLPLASISTDSLRYALRPPRLSKRRLAYIGFLGILLLCLVVPVSPDLLGSQRFAFARSAPDKEVSFGRMVSAKFLQAWNPGPLAQAHRTFGADCRACHQFPFVHVRDQACIACHKTIKEHVPALRLTAAAGQAFRNMRCAQCHRDHKGMKMAQGQCADCHRDVKRLAADAESGKATDFGTEHPEFRLSLVDADKPDVVRRVRQSTPDAPEMVEHSNLKFNHKLHLDPGGVRDPEGKRDIRGTRDAQGRRTILKCGDCHEPNRDGRLMAPVSMEKHCQRCHSLAFEAKVTTRQAVHGDEAAVATMLREFYARLALGSVPPGVNPPQDLPRMRPGAALTYQDRQRVLKIADDKANQVLRELFETRKVCSTCHEVTRKEDGAGWKVAPVRITQVWMPGALFSHAKHVTRKCTECHDVLQAKDSQHIAMPNIATCRACHSGAAPIAGKVTSDCAGCHRFHDGGGYWQGALQAQLLRKDGK